MAVFKTFHRLEHIFFGGAGGLTAMFRGLRRTSDEAPHCCPRLSVVEMDPKSQRIVATDCLFDSMHSALSVRAEKGLHLERVHLGLVHDTDDHYPKNEAMYGERLRALVPCVEYFSIGTSELPHVVRRCQVDGMHLTALQR